MISRDRSSGRTVMEPSMTSSRVEDALGKALALVDQRRHELRGG
jgi:hypothetical protein